ncbi:hypothetical protein AB5L52_43145 [Streptomyces sp. CG4]|uniref:hypothetical protein n=1 Tax=Streptomyces sp. CG4 TaxID=408783 RepID=UPI0034E21774
MHAVSLLLSSVGNNMNVQEPSAAHLPQANWLLMPAEQFHGVCQIRGLDAPAARVPQSTSTGKAEQLSRRGRLVVARRSVL